VDRSSDYSVTITKITWSTVLGLHTRFQIPEDQFVNQSLI